MVKYYVWSTIKKKYNQPLYTLLYNFYNYLRTLEIVSQFFINFCINERIKIGQKYFRTIKIFRMSQDVGKLRCQIAKVPLYMYNVGKYQIHLHLLRNRTEKLARLLFYLFLKLVQINYIFSDNVCTCMYIVYLFT
jgi:hypothetical protein